jgi:hypothetical protein
MILPVSAHLLSRRRALTFTDVIAMLVVFGALLAILI